MSTSKYGQDVGSERNIGITIGESHVHFTIESVKAKKEEKRERLRLAFGMAREKANASKFWEDNDESPLEDQLTDIFFAMLVSAEVSYRNGLVWHREWIIERKASAAAELTRRKEEAERKVRELEEKAARERIAHLLAQAKALGRANQIRAYVDAALLRVKETAMAPADVEQWVIWARQEADRIDPVKNGVLGEAIRQHVQASANPVP